ncbi:MAG: hypothetical protein HYW27_04040 [Candidatus Aenigmarchaeota archaeon]|nr:hypothetical protein [Candidatus Aenigmarchaeota archaeon]
MNMFLAAGVVVAVIVIAAAFTYAPQLPGTESGISNMPVLGGTDINETIAEEPAEETGVIGTPSQTKTPEAAPADSRPDLVLESITLDPKTPLVNELITFTATLKNNGGSGIDSFSFTLSPLVDQASIVSSASAASPSLAPGDTTTIRLQAKITVPGPAKVKSTVDTFNNINETNETNNQLVVPFRVYTKQSWAGCSGNGKSVCADLVDAGYFTQYPNCIRNSFKYFPVIFFTSESFIYYKLLYSSN